MIKIFEKINEFKLDGVFDEEVWWKFMEIFIELVLIEYMIMDENVKGFFVKIFDKLEE